MKNSAGGGNKAIGVGIEEEVVPGELGAPMLLE